MRLFDCVCLACITIVCFTLALAEERPRAVPPRVLIPCRVLSVHDGDTIKADVAFPWSITLTDQDVRLLGFDAWEITRTRRTVTITETELAQGRIARDELQQLINDSERVFLSPGEQQRDPHGRLPAFLFVWDADADKGRGKLTDVAEWMRAQGHDRGTAE